jgi:hypothetical protein
MIAFAFATGLGALINWNFLFLTGTIAFSLASWAVFFVLVRIIAKNFNTKLFSSNGYLTLTTPVSIDALILSKIIVSMLWTLVIILGLVFSSTIILSAVFNSDWSGFGYLLFTALWTSLSNYTGRFVLVLIQVFLIILCIIVTLLFVLVLTNTGRLRKYKALKGIFIFIGIFFVLASLMSLFGEAMLNTSFLAFQWISIVLMLVWSVGTYFLSRFLIKTKLELE